MAAKAALSALAAACGVAAAVSASAFARGEAPRACTTKFVSGAMHLCGPATAHLSVFGSYTFRNGTCKRAIVGGEPDFVLELGAIKVPPNATNGGLSYLKIQIDGPLPNPTSGSLIAYHNGKRWAGLGDSFKGNSSGGSFVVTAIPANGGRRATGSFRC